MAYFHWTGLEQHTNASQTVRAISLLYALTGCFDAPGGNVRPTRPAANDLAPLALLPEAQRAKALGLAERPLGPGAPGLDDRRATLTAPSCTARRTRVRGMVGFGANLLLSQPDARRGARRARRGSTSSSTPISSSRRRRRWPTWCCPCPRRGSARACAWASGRRTRASGTSSSGRAAVAPRGEARSDIWITCELARRLGLGDRFFGGDEDAGHAFMLEPSGVTLTALRERPEGISVPRRASLPSLRRGPGRRRRSDSPPRAGAWRSTPARCSRSARRRCPTTSSRPRAR